jgi:hypothetical protein
MTSTMSRRSPDRDTRYPALALWEREQRAGVPSPATDPLRIAAIYEVQAREWDDAAAASDTAHGRRVARKVADEYLAQARTVLASARRKTVAHAR